MTDSKPAGAAPPARYMPALDGVRGICMLAVLIGHLTIFGGTGLLFQPQMVNLLGGGELCLEVFFVLSGALITHLALSEITKTGGFDLRKFRNRRVRRLAPAAILILITTITLCVTGLHDDTVPLGTKPTLVALSVLALSSNWLLFSHANLGYLTPTWSLSVEEQFYLAWPLTLRRTWLRLGAAGSAMAATALLVAGVGTAAVMSGRGVYATYATPVAGVALLSGCLVAIGLHSASGPALRRILSSTPLAVVLALGIGFGARWLHFHTTASLRGGYLGFDVATALFIGHLMVRSTRPSTLSRALGVRPVAYLGRISYGAYLFHATIYQMWDHSGLIPNVAVRGVVDVTSALVVASISYRFLEEPIRQGRLRLPKRRARVARTRTPVTAWARLRFVPPLAFGVAAVVVVLQFAPPFHPLKPQTPKVEVAASVHLVPGCATATVQRAAGISTPDAVVACDGQWALAAAHSDHGRMELLRYQATTGWQRLNTEHGALLDAEPAVDPTTPGRPKLTTVQRLASEVGPVAAPAAAAAQLVSTAAATSGEPDSSAVVASPVITRDGQRWFAVLIPARAGSTADDSEQMWILQWQQERWHVVGLVGGLPSIAGATYRIGLSSLASTVEPTWVFQAAHDGTTSVGVVSDLSGSWQLANLTNDNGAGPLTTLAGQ